MLWLALALEVLGVRCWGGGTAGLSAALEMTSSGSGQGFWEVGLGGWLRTREPGWWPRAGSGMVRMRAVQGSAETLS